MCVDPVKSLIHTQQAMDAASTRQCAVELSLERVQQNLERNMETQMEAHTQSLVSSQKSEMTVIRKQVDSLQEKVDRIESLILDLHKHNAHRDTQVN